jgi:hypothetical protein
MTYLVVNKRIVLLITLVIRYAFVLVAICLPSVAATDDSIPYRIIWFSPNDTFQSWNWVEFSKGDDDTMKI